MSGQSNNNTWRLSVKVGDLVSDVEAISSDPNRLGLIIMIDEPEGMYKVRFPNRAEWLTEMYLELVSESR